MGEGEVVMSNLVDALGAGDSLAKVKGVAYRDGDQVVINEREKLIKDVDAIPWPAWDLFRMDYYTMMRAPGIRSDGTVPHGIYGQRLPVYLQLLLSHGPRLQAAQFGKYHRRTQDPPTGLSRQLFLSFKMTCS